MNYKFDIKPSEVFHYFELISSVARGSGNTKAVSDICVAFAKEQGLEYVQDELNNIIIYKPATPDKKGSEPVILQGHLDMVCVKDGTTDIDMSKEPVELMVEGDWLKANGTSLGGDDGAAVAMAMAILADNTISHPPIEAVFTVDEETGMDGAFGLDMSLLKGRRLINIDSEAEGVFTVGCAGGLRVNSKLPVVRNAVPDGLTSIKVSISGLLGGHSGAEINLEHGNANMLLARVLLDAKKGQDILLASYEGGKFDNAITDTATAYVYVEKDKTDVFVNSIIESDKVLKAEYKHSDKNVNVTAVQEVCPVQGVLDKVSTDKVLKLVNVLPYGIQSMSMAMKGLVETSLNLGVTRLEADSFEFSHSIRSSVETRKIALTDKLVNLVEAFGGSCSMHGDYPGWEYAAVSPLRDKCIEVYKKQSGKEPVVIAIHAGLECGLFASKLEGLDSVSIGPDMKDIHTPREMLSIPSVARVYDFLINLLAEL